MIDFAGAPLPYDEQNNSHNKARKYQGSKKVMSNKFNTRNTKKKKEWCQSHFRNLFFLSFVSASVYWLKPG